MANRKHYRKSADAFRQEYEAATDDATRGLILRLAREQGRVYALENHAFRMQSFLDAITVKTVTRDDL